jgi:hypothetical protein
MTIVVVVIIIIIIIITGAKFSRNWGPPQILSTRGIT